ncbi:MAG: FAD:protein FMN transferase [Alcanivorax sp.]|nr:FAD:protein FMN transferase [Alcanivorax sp.]
MPEVRRARPLLGTFVEIQPCGPQDRCQAAISAAFAVMQTVHDRLSFQSPVSELTRLNQAGGDWLALSSLSLRVLALARAMTALSGRRFNATVGGELVAAGVLPDHGGDYLPCGEENDIQLRPGAARLARPVRLTVDGLAKGYAVDCAVLALKRAGIRQGAVNAGGDLRLFGEQPQPLLVRNPSGRVLMQGEGVNLALATSAQQPAEPDRFPGYLVGAAQPGCHCWSVCARFAWRADALTKVAACTPAAQRAERIRALGGLLLEPSAQQAA